MKALGSAITRFEGSRNSSDDAQNDRIQMAEFSGPRDEVRSLCFMDEGNVARLSYHGLKDSAPTSRPPD